MPIARRHDTYFVSAGEFSGDLIGADLVRALRPVLPKTQPFGVAGDAMLQSGVEPVATTDDFNVMGVLEVAKNLSRFRMLESRILQRIEQMDPKFAVLIDNPGFHIRLAGQLKLRGIKVYQYVAPKLWAWGEGRTELLRRNFSMVMGILPFEEPFFRSRQIPYTYVGSPLKDRTDKVIVRKEALGIPGTSSVIACLTGSRPSEVERILPHLLAIKRQVEARIPDALFLAPMARSLQLSHFEKVLGERLKAVPGGNGVGVDCFETKGIRFIRGMSLEVMAAADVAVVASGTATLECALLGTPLVVVYAMNDLTYEIAKRAVKLPYVSLVNLLVQRPLVKEFIQEFSVSDVCDEILFLLKDPAKRKLMVDQFEDLRDSIKGGAADSAAKVISDTYETKITAPGQW